MTHSHYHRSLSNGSWPTPMNTSIPVFPSNGQNGSVPITPTRNNATDSTLEAAEAIVAAAVIQQGIYNAWRVDNPRRNTYKSRFSANSSTESQSKRKRDEEPVAPHLNATILAAAALIAHRDALAQAANGTLKLSPYLPLDAGQSQTATNLTVRQSGSQDPGDYWVNEVAHDGLPVMGANPDWMVYRDVTNPMFAGGAKGDGIHDDTAAINAAISYGGNCGQGCLSSSVKSTFIYFPRGTYLISSPINAYYYSQLVSDPNGPALIKTSASFIGLGAIQTDVYVPGASGSEWYIEQSNFYRQVRNFDINISATMTAKVAGLHWQVAQATSLLNVNIFASTSSTTTQIGIFTENGSSGFMSDVNVDGGAYGLYGGNQQYTVRSFIFGNQQIANICLIWDWGWTWSDLWISSSPIGILLINPEAPNGPQAGSTYIMDSQFTNVGTAIKAKTANSSILDTSVITLDNVGFSNVNEMMLFSDGTSVPVPGFDAVYFTVYGNAFNGTDTEFDPKTGIAIDIQHPDTSLTGPPETLIATPLQAHARPPYFKKTRPQYSNITIGNIVDVKSHGAKGDGITDDTAAIQSALSAATTDNVIYFPPGSYIITDTITVPPNCRITGRVWSQLVAKGANFQNILEPTVMLRVGNPGDIGEVEISDMLFTSTGALPGLIVVEWNVAAAYQGAVGMWDSHFRIGGAAGTDLGVSQCPHTIDFSSTPSCWGAAMLLHITDQANGYFENVWAWVADHDIDDPQNAQITVGVGRGILVESSGPTWFYGTASEHSIIYQYNFNGANNIFAGMIQTESPYYQDTATSLSPGPWGFSGAALPTDPFFLDGTCWGDAETCDFAWAVVVNSTNNLTIAGAGLYSWFDNYDQSTCVDDQACQQRIFRDAGGNTGFNMFNLVTIGSVEMVSAEPDGLVMAHENTQATAHPFWSLLGAYTSDQSLGSCDDDPSQAGCYLPPPCDWSLTFPDLDALNAAAASFPPACVDYYTISTLLSILQNDVLNYTNNINPGYDQVYQYYVQYVQELVQPSLDEFMNLTNGVGNQYFECTMTEKGFPNRTHTCPPDWPGKITTPTKLITTYTLVNESGFWGDLESIYGLTPTEVQFGYTSTPYPCVSTKRSIDEPDSPIPPPTCISWEADSYGYPQVASDFSIQNPKDAVLQGLAKVQNLTMALTSQQVQIATGGWFAEDNDDITQVMSMPVFLFSQSLEGMAIAKQQGKATEIEDKKNYVIKVLSILFSVLAFMPEILPATFGLRTVVGLAAAAGNAGLSLQAIVEDPSSAPMEMAGLLGGGLGIREEDMAAMAAIRRDIEQTTMSKMGELFNTLNSKLEKAASACAA